MTSFQVKVRNTRTHQTVTLRRRATSYEQACEDAVITMFRWGRDNPTVDRWNSCESGSGIPHDAAYYARSAGTEHKAMA